MNRSSRWALCIGLIAGLAACSDEKAPRHPSHHAPPDVAAMPSRALPGGDTTFINRNPENRHSMDGFSQPSANLPVSERGRFAVGNSFFTNAWISAPASTTARDGLGPLYSAAACQDCHIRDGRGHPPPDADTPVMAGVLTLATSDGGRDPVYGRQLQTFAVQGAAPEARVRVRWVSFIETLPDGAEVSMRRPRWEASEWSHGMPEQAVQLGFRIGPPMIGLGLLEAIPSEAIEAEAARQQAEPTSPMGRVNRVRAQGTDAVLPGRFGWKASQPSVRQQALKAFAHDLGITSALFPEDECTPVQTNCRALPNGGEPELSASIADAVVFYSRHLAPPARRYVDRRDVTAGEALFADIGCADCHRPSWTTGNDAEATLANQTIWPYTDLLLHDMGEGLADGLREGEAGPRDWRTPPLWGLSHAKPVGGAHAGFLHDGRARTIAEAILWHGGEARAARDAWAALPAPDRQRVIRFLASL